MRLRCLAQSGQLGHGDRMSRNVPTVVAGLDGIPAVFAACGKARAAAWAELRGMQHAVRSPASARAQAHTLVVAANGDAYAFGTNKHGQLGTGSVKNKPKEDDVALTPVKCAVAGVVSVACGSEFTAWVRVLAAARA